MLEEWRDVQSKMRIHRLKRWVTAWATLMDGLCSVLSFGFWWPNLSFKATYWQVQAQLDEARGVSDEGMD